MTDQTDVVVMDITVNAVAVVNGIDLDAVAIGFHQGPLHLTVVVPLTNIGAFQEALLDGINGALCEIVTTPTYKPTVRN